MDNTAGHESLRGMIGKLRQLQQLPQQSAPAVAEALSEEIKSSIAAGKAPDGQPWQLTKDGRVPLQHADRALTVSAIGSVIVARLDGHHARHHLGAVRGKVKRQILPSKKLTAQLARAIKGAIVNEFNKTMTGGS